MKINMRLLVLGTFYGCSQSVPSSVPVDETSMKPNALDTTASTAQQQVPINVPTNEHDTVDYRFAKFLPPGSTYAVIAISGAPLQEEPDANAPVIKIIKFGETIQIIEKLHSEILQDAISETNMSGTWVKVKHHNGEGYMFSAFLASGRYPFTDANEFDIMLKGRNCVPNFKYSPAHHYYAIYDTDEGAFLKQVKLSFYVIHEIPEGADIWEWYTIDTDFYGSPTFILGAPKKFQEKKINSVSVQTFEPGSTHQHGAYKIKVDSKYDGYWTVLNFVDSNGKIIQAIETGDLIWCGDVDQDGKMDFLYLEGEPKAGSVVLALSSHALPGQAFKIVGNYESSSCC
jgi:hypothetical protein